MLAVIVKMYQRLERPFWDVFACVWICLITLGGSRKVCMCKSAPIATLHINTIENSSAMFGIMPRDMSPHMHKSDGVRSGEQLLSITNMDRTHSHALSLLNEIKDLGDSSPDGQT